MSTLKSPRLPNPWPAAKAAPLPASVAALLALTLGALLLLPPPAPILPATMMAPPHAIPSTAAITPVIVPAAIGAAPIFAPDRRGSGGGIALVGGLDVLGTALSSRGASAVVRTDGGTIETVRLGSRIGDWHLLAVGRDRATFEGPDGIRTLHVGVTAQAVAASAPSSAGDAVQ
jgi:hypothetical protein